MGRRLIHRWETLGGRNRVLVGIPIALVVLYLFHQAFFPLLDWKESLTYSVMECVPVSLLIAWATENELRRRRDLAERIAAAEAAAGSEDDDPLARG